MNRDAERKPRTTARGGVRGWPHEVTGQVAVGFGALAGLCTTFAVALSLLLADGLSWGLALTWLLFLAAGPALATLLFSRPEDGRRPVRAIGQGLLSVVFQAVWAAPFVSILSVVVRADSPFWPPLLLWLLNSAYCAYWVTHVSRERPGGSAGRHQRPARPSKPSPPPPSPRLRTTQEERAITEFGELLTAHPFDASLPGVEYVEVADHSLALDAYDRAKAAAAGDVLGILAEGRAALARLDARMGLDTLLSRTCCFFDHRHGPAVIGVDWAPRGGVPRRVEVCRADAVRLADEQQ